MAAHRRIKLRRLAIKQANHLYIHCFRLRVEVVEAQDMDRYVFMYRRTPPDPYTGDSFNEFIGVASVPDLAEYPVGNPDYQSANPFFRLDFIEVDVRSMTEYQRTWNKIVSEVCSLRNALDVADNMVVEEEVWCGDSYSASSLSA